MIPYRAEDFSVTVSVADYIARFRDAERFEGLVQFTAENIETYADVTVDNHPFRSGDPTRQRHIIAKDFLLAQIVRRIDVVLVYACFRLLDGKYKLCGFS